MTNQKPNFKKGDIATWQEPGVYNRTLAVMKDDTSFDWALHHCDDMSNCNGNDNKLWYDDEIPEEASNIDYANRYSVLDAVDIMLVQGKPITVQFRMEAGKTVGSIIELVENKKTISTPAENRKIRWKNYLKEALTHYHSTGKYYGMSYIASKYHVTGVSQIQFGLLRLNEVNPEDVTDELVQKVIDMVSTKKGKTINFSPL